MADKSVGNSDVKLARLSSWLTEIASGLDRSHHEATTRSYYGPVCGTDRDTMDSAVGYLHDLGYPVDAQRLKRTYYALVFKWYSEFVTDQVEKHPEDAAFWDELHGPFPAPPQNPAELGAQQVRRLLLATGVRDLAEFILRLRNDVCRSEDTCKQLEVTAESEQTKQANVGMGWQEAQKEAEKNRLCGKPFTSYNKMAETIGCSSTVLHKAIHTHGTVELQEWASKQRGVSRLNATPEVAAVAFKNAPQGRETDPAEILYNCDVDSVLAKLKAEVSPDDWERITKDMTPAELRAIAETAYRDPDKEEQNQRYAEVKKKHSRRD